MTPRILYLHGLLSSPQSRKAQFLKEKLAARGEDVVIPDLTQGDFHNLTTSRAVSQVVSLAREMTPPVVLMGSSFGGRVALLAAAALGQRVAGLVLMAPALSMNDAWHNMTREEVARSHEQGWIRVNHPLLGDDATLGIAFYRDMAVTDRRPSLSPDVPILLLHGRQDDVTPFCISLKYSEKNPGVRLVGLDADHRLSGQHDRIWSEVEPFMGEVLVHW